ncbi:diaminohydroxyphosphoribosylaminopyrimidine deaminase/5-amino-6-(5-phosphoribosylamino)uracil reductase [Pseudorhizobium tarimense]|uniref:Riboflavin biosynthesis protein RibD n=1 Tax=Pseudorhizobium tarimense TaxID=1079109 RepID=A0ABV2H5T3_9HYPH|nr:bifunctional diaminohydroxyphosphoribosylaminopyrimidine deaminase/5-amino-6-(5-phosphoribosylamino)uracil reductase RibD [Pseudorhizobium tarimense]MCJ8519248.1 bifunctional diaminohydroxyphosphoribosylaminopyrimidine deaminase/5-amino-6-(5-phosphoribosylamino)uracil reductase RibD [Pseudorhizobium tarimense]
MAVSHEDLRYMAAAMRLSRWHTGLTATNPSVAALVVRDGAIVGRAVTAPGGRPHAETQALTEAGERARGATLYVTLEPCSHHGKTPPCADAIVKAGIARVVVSLTDPDPRVSGRGLANLREAGVAVESGVMEEEGRRVLSAYLMRQTRGRPQVILKLAVSADGMIGRRGDGQVSITGPAARAQVHVLRAETDAILIGIGTALADDPELTCRTPGLQARSPLRIVLDRRLELPPTSKLVRTAREVPVLLTSLGSAADGSGRPARRAALTDAGVEVMVTESLDMLLNALAARGVSSLLVEGGAAVATSFLASGLVHRILLFEGAVTVGADGIASPLTRADIPAGFRLLREAAFGPDRLTEYERSF